MIYWRKGLRTAILGFMGSAAAAATATADSVADFYKDKTVSIVIGTPPGGIYQLYGQLFIAHMRKHIPGNPTMIPMHMPGAGGAKAANFVYAAAAQDGSHILLAHPIPIAQMLRPKGIRFESDKFQWLGAYGQSVQTLALWHEAPVKSLDEAKKKEAILGSFARGHSTYQWGHLVNTVLGTRFRVIPGYRGGAANNLAMERGETHGWAASYDNLSSTKPQWLAQKKVNILAQFGFERLPQLRDVPTLLELTSPAQRDVVEFVTAGSVAARSVGVGPKVPADRVAALRKAFDATAKDPAFVAEAKKRKLSLHYRSAAELDVIVKKIVGASPALVARVKKATGQAE